MTEGLAIKILKNWQRAVVLDEIREVFEMAINALEQQKDCQHDCGNCWKTKLVKQRWIPFTERKTDEEEKEVYGFDYILNCKLPDDEQEIIVSYANGCVDTDIFMKDGNECYLESGCVFVNEAVAWQPLPEPYEGE